MGFVRRTFLGVLVRAGNPWLMITQECDSAVSCELVFLRPWFHFDLEIGVGRICINNRIGLSIGAHGSSSFFISISEA